MSRFFQHLQNIGKIQENGCRIVVRMDPELFFIFYILIENEFYGIFRIVDRCQRSHLSGHYLKVLHQAVLRTEAQPRAPDLLCNFLYINIFILGYCNDKNGDFPLHP